MIARIWRGRTPGEKAEAYHDYLRATGLKEYAETPGNRGVFALRRIEGGVAEFLLLTLWESMDSVRRFAGEDPERPVYYPDDDEYLLEREPLVSHYDVLEAPPRGPIGGSVAGTTDEREHPGEDPTIQADWASPTEPGPGDSEGAKPEPPPDGGRGQDRRPG
ncbi:MAG TPA: hypothetical protein VE962_00220 [Actinomycetota bacterium]|nr:hypothetical protein [Actinomycetota bacterium]